MTVTATYSGEELSVTFVAPNMPVWDEVNSDSIEILHFDILGIDVDPRILPQELQDAIHALSNEVKFE